MLQLLYIIGIILALLWCVCWCGTKYTNHQQRKKEREMVSPTQVDLEEADYQPKILSFKKAMGDITSV
jgi:hypothetical protein